MHTFCVHIPPSSGNYDDLVSSLQSYFQFLPPDRFQQRFLSLALHVACRFSRTRDNFNFRIQTQWYCKHVQIFSTLQQYQLALVRLVKLKAR